MKILEITPSEAKLSLSRNELLIVNAALNEVCNGIALFEFETRLGAKRDRVEALLKEVRALSDQMESADT